MDVAGFETLLRNLESGAIRVVARDVTELLAAWRWKC